MTLTLGRIARGLRKPPSHIAKRVWTEARHQLDRFTVPVRGRKFDAAAFLRHVGMSSIDAAWDGLKRSPRPWPVANVSKAALEASCPGEAERIFQAAQRACDHQIDLLGSGLVELGRQIDWHRDYKTGDRWPYGYFKYIDYVNRDRPSDVKTVWELSRMQWLIPAGQAYLLTGDERYAAAVRDVIDQWIAANPYAWSVNWGVTMEPAMRIFTWTWLFHVFAESRAWSEPQFRGRFLTSLYLHAEFTERFIERTDVNGNHLTANLAALVAAGAFFAPFSDAARWFDTGVHDLEHEIRLQVLPDGVDFEASVAYHRLVAELFLHASLWAEARGKVLSDVYRERLRGMGQFAAAYVRPDGTTPLWGDADDARVLPFGGQGVNDHRYLPGVIGVHLNDSDLMAASGGPKPEAFWLFGERGADLISAGNADRGSQAFEDGGFFVMRNGKDHVFIDCGRLGLADRGGHGHNDILSFEAMLDRELLIVDCGSYLYTASFHERNLFRSTATHNTPRVDGQEINRFISPEYLWNLHCDAHPDVREWHQSAESDRIVMSHSGYQKLPQPVTPVRRIELRHEDHSLRIEDRFEGVGEHEIRIPLQFAPGVRVERQDPNVLILVTPRRKFRLHWQSGSRWDLDCGSGRVSPSYGVVLDAPRVEWSRIGPIDADLRVEISLL